MTLYKKVDNLTKKQMMSYLSCSYSLLKTLEKDQYLIIDRSSYQYLFSISKDFELDIAAYKHKNISNARKLMWSDPECRKHILDARQSKECLQKFHNTVIKTWSNADKRKQQSIVCSKPFQNESYRNFHRKRTSEGTKKAYEEKGSVILQNIYNTKKKNRSFNKSKIAENCKQYLKDKGFIIEEEKPYPNENNLHCDIYIIKLDLWIELHFSHFHNCEPFDINNKIHLNWLKDLEERANSHTKTARNTYNQYHTIIYTWTNLDVRKFENAKNNKLNWIAFYNVEDFYNYVDTLIKEKEEN